MYLNNSFPRNYAGFWTWGWYTPLYLPAEPPTEGLD